jgi:hypothetical protein
MAALPQLLAAADVEQRDGKENDGEHNHQQILHRDSGPPGD